MSVDDIKDAIQAMKLDKDTAYLIVYNPRFVKVEDLIDAFEWDVFKDIKAVAIAVTDIDAIKIFGLKDVK